MSVLYIAQGIPIYYLGSYSGGNPREFGDYFQKFCAYMYNTFYHSISRDSLQLYTSCIEMYRSDLETNCIKAYDGGDLVGWITC